MTVLRRILLLVLLAGLIPWGAWSGAGLGARLDRAAMMQTGLHHAGGPAVETGDGAAQAVLQPPPRRCQRSALPGGPCAPDLMVPRAVESLRPAPAAAAYPLVRLAARPDWTPPGALDPPRAG